MADNVLDSFLVNILCNQDESSRKKFDAGLKSIQDNAQEFGKKISELPEIVHEATKKISLSLTSLYYAAQQTRATEQELHAFSRGIKDSGGDVDQANASYKSFVENINLYGSGLTKSIQDITKVTVDAEHPMQGYIAVWDKLHEMFMRGGEDRARAGKFAEAWNIPVDQLALGREQFHKSFIEDIGRTGVAYGEAAKQASLFQIALNKVEAAFSNVVTKADVEIMNDYVGALDRISKWVDDNQDKVIKFLKDFVEQFRIAFHELKDTFGPALEWLGSVIMDTFASLDKFLGNDDGGVKGLRIALEALFAMSLLAGLARLGATLTLAMLPVTKFMMAAMALGLLGAGAYALYRSYVDQDALGGGAGGAVMPGGGRGHETSLAGRTGVHRAGGAGTAGSGAGTGTRSGWWTPERQKHAYDVLKEGGLSDMGARGLISRWKNVEAPGGPSSSNNLGGGHYGIGQWSRARGAPIWGNPDFDAQLQHALKEIHTGAAGGGSEKALITAKTAEEGAIAASRFERAEHFNLKTGVDDWTARTLRGMSDINMPDFSYVRKAIEGKPLGSDQHSMNQINDYRSVDNDVNIHVTGASSVDMTTRPLSRPRNADLIRNTSSYVS